MVLLYHFFFHSLSQGCFVPCKVVTSRITDAGFLYRAIQRNVKKKLYATTWNEKTVDICALE